MRSIINSHKSYHCSEDNVMINAFSHFKKNNAPVNGLVANTPAEVVLILEECKSSLSVAEWACDAFAGFTAKAVQARNAEAMAQLLDEGICECLVSTMNQHCASSLEVAIKGCKALRDLSWTSRELREFLGEIGACECVVFALTMHIGDPEVSEYGSATLINLSKDNISNSYRQARAGACEILVQTGNFGFNLRHPKCTTVASNVCSAICNLCEAVNQPKLAESGACELVAALLKFHMETFEVVAAASRAICGLASLTSGNRDVMGKAGACRLIVNAMNEHKDAIGIIESCCEGIMHLALNSDNTKLFHICGGCEAIVKALDIHLMEREFGAEICVGGMLNLITYGTCAKDNAILLYKLGVVNILKRVQVSTHASQRARENSLQILRNFEILGLLSHEEQSPLMKNSLRNDDIYVYNASDHINNDSHYVDSNKKKGGNNLTSYNDLEDSDGNYLLSRTSTENELSTGVFEI